VRTAWAGLSRGTQELTCTLISWLIRDVGHTVDRNVPREYRTSASWKRSHAGQLPTIISDILPTVMWAFICVMLVLYICRVKKDRQHILAMFYARKH
jgi:hypothetical protein